VCIIDGIRRFATVDPVKKLGNVESKATLGRATIQFSEDSAPVPLLKFASYTTGSGAFSQHCEYRRQRRNLRLVRQIPSIENFLR
jgi:hypothetical protein